MQAHKTVIFSSASTRRSARCCLSMLSKWLTILSQSRSLYSRVFYFSERLQAATSTQQSHLLSTYLRANGKTTCCGSSWWFKLSSPALYSAHSLLNLRFSKVNSGTSLRIMSLKSARKILPTLTGLLHQSVMAQMAVNSNLAHKFSSMKPYLLPFSSPSFSWLKVDLKQVLLEMVSPVLLPLHSRYSPASKLVASSEVASTRLSDSRLEFSLLYTLRTTTHSNTTCTPSLLGL